MEVQSLAFVGTWLLKFLTVSKRFLNYDRANLIKESYPSSHLPERDMQRQFIIWEFIKNTRIFTMVIAY